MPKKKDIISDQSVTRTKKKTLLGSRLKLKSLKLEGDEFTKTSEFLLVLKRHKGSSISIREILDGIQEGSFGLILFVLCAPMVIPLPPSGIGTAFGIPIMVICLQLLYGCSTPWLPQWLGRQTIGMKTLNYVVDKVLPYLKKLEKVLKPRYPIYQTKLGRQMVGSLMVIGAVLIILPIPFSNIIPGFGMCLVAIGLLERDGLVIKAGLAVIFAGIFICTYITILVWDAVVSLDDCYELNGASGFLTHCIKTLWNF